MATGVKPYSSFVAGLITEAGPLTFPENASFDELNCILFRQGNRRRRLGVDFENGYSLSVASQTLATVRDKALGTHVWTSVAGNGARNFLIIQIDTVLHYYDLSTEPLSSGKKSFTTNLATYTASGATDIGAVPISVTAGKGLVFISSQKIEPFSVEYNPTGDSITETQINIQIRDFEGLDESPALTNDEEPATLSTSHNYNLKNQGWSSPGEGIADPTTTYFTDKSKYPPNSKQWWVAKNADDTFTSDLLSKFESGNTKAPRGHFKLNPFYQDRSAVSGVAGIPVVNEDNRPEFIDFYAGRVWYFGIESSNINGHVYFSQVLTETDKAGLCHQESDPTTEDLSELIENDGGVIVIPEIGTIRGSLVISDSLVIFASNGVWQISGASQDGFKATDFQVKKVTPVGCTSSGSVIDVEGAPFWWSDTGIYTLGSDQVSGMLKAQSMSQNTIETFYQEQIPALSKTYTRSVYDPATKRVYWFYNTVAPSNDEYKWRYNAALIFDFSIGAFYPWKISDLANESPFIINFFNTQSVNASSRTERVADAAGDTLIASGGDVVVDVNTIAGSNTFLKWFVMVPDGAGAFNYTFATFNNGDFVDWETKDGTGITYDSYLETGYELFGDIEKDKQSVYTTFFFQKSETATAGGALVNPSSCFVRAKWDWTDSSEAGKWSIRRQIYSLKRLFDSGILTDEKPGQTVIIAREKVRGRGKALQYRFESEDGKDFNLLGWNNTVSIQDGF
jgi:hypothetical protein